MSDPPGATLAAAPALHQTIPTILEPDADAEERGRLKRRRPSSHSPRRASSPSRGHDRTSGSRYRQHHRKHHRPSSPSTSASPPTSLQKKSRRRSDAEPDHTFRGRVRNRSGSRGRTESPLLEDNDDDRASDGHRKARKRSAPPSRHRANEKDESADIRRQRSYPNLYTERRDSKGGDAEKMGPVDKMMVGGAEGEAVA